MNAEPLLYGNDPVALFVALGIAAAVLGIVWALRGLARWKLRNARETATEVDDFLLGGAVRTKIWLLSFPVLFLSTRALRLPESLQTVLKYAAALAVIAQIAHWVAGLVDFQAGRYRRQRLATDPASTTTLNVFRLALVAAIWIVAALVALRNLGLDVSALLTGLGIGGVAVALATQNILGDLFASLSIVVDKPFQVGDFITVGESSGTVERVGLKTTHIRSQTGEQLIIGNADLLKNPIRNFKRMAERRVAFRIGIARGTSAGKLERIPELVRAAVQSQPGIRFERSNLITFADSAYDFESVYWVPVSEASDPAAVHHAICLDIVRAMEAEELELAYPTRTVHLSGGQA